MSTPERERQKAARSATCRAERDVDRPPRDKQLGLLRQLGHIALVGNRREATELIRALLRRRARRATP